MSSVLDGVRVIDFGQYIAGPLTAILAYTAMLHQSLFIQSYAGKRWHEASGPDRLGSGPPCWHTRMESPR